MSESVLAAYGLSPAQAILERIGSGLINHTWKVWLEGQCFILQRINQDVFASPEDIACNTDIVAAYLKEQHPGYHFAAPLSSREGRSLIFREGEGYYRLFPFIDGSHSKDTVGTAEQAYEAARQFGRFTKLLSGLDADRLRITIPRFHDLEYRQAVFLKTIQEGDLRRKKEAKDLIRHLLEHAEIAAVYGKIRKSADFHIRVTHHDTKISNVLFDEAGKGICVIDLDTLMPGYFISDVGDMMRTYLSPVGEETDKASEIEVRTDFYQAIREGYCGEMESELSQEEKAHFFYSSLFMTYMQAIRFLTDYLNGDRYYAPAYPGHNLVRARNQYVLLQRLLEKRRLLEKV